MVFARFWCFVDWYKLLVYNYLQVVYFVLATDKDVVVLDIENNKHI